VEHTLARDGVELVNLGLIDTPEKAFGGATWYPQFMFYGMGATRMGAYDFGSWTLHMAFIIVFSNLWAVRLGE
jgi:hypothetical protein